MIDWQDFTKTQFGEFFTHNFIADADDLGLILVTGNEAESEKHNELSMDISQPVMSRCLLRCLSC